MDFKSKFTTSYVESNKGYSGASVLHRESDEA
jgi:hypothetical protein